MPLRCQQPFPVGPAGWPTQISRSASLGREQEDRRDKEHQYHAEQDGILVETPAAYIHRASHLIVSSPVRAPCHSLLRGIRVRPALPALAPEPACPWIRQNFLPNFLPLWHHLTAPRVLWHRSTIPVRRANPASLDLWSRWSGVRVPSATPSHRRGILSARPRSSADRAAAFEAARGGSTPPGATPP